MCVFTSSGPSSDNIEEDMIASSRGASATVLEESRKETTPVQLPVSGPELAAMMKIGTRVVRGVDWKWGDQVQLLSYKFGCVKISVQWTVCEFYAQTLKVILHFKDLEN